MRVLSLEHGADDDAGRDAGEDGDAEVDPKIVQAELRILEALERLGDDVYQGCREDRARREHDAQREVDSARDALVDEKEHPREAAARRSPTAGGVGARVMR